MVASNQRAYALGESANQINPLQIRCYLRSIEIASVYIGV